MEAVVLQLHGVSKAFPGVQALDDVTLSVARGEVHALLGANGAGKSTLIKILAGAVPKDFGEIVFDGKRIGSTDPHDAVDRGIAVLYQEPALVPHLSVEQNIFLGQEQTGRFGLIRLKEQRRKAQAVLASIAPKLNPAQRIDELRTSERQLVALAKAFLRRPKLLILDEPTASMTDLEIRALFEIVSQVRQTGTSVIYITHRLEEVFTVANRVTVLRDGKHILTKPIEEIDRAELVNSIAGRELRTEERRADARPGTPLLVVEKLRRAGVFTDISFAVREGEIVALAGLVGAGRTEIVRAIFGADPIDGGTIRFPRSAIRVENPADAVRAGLALVPEDRKGQGIIPKMSVEDNLMLSSIPHCAYRGGIIDTAKMRAAVSRCVQQIDIRPRGAEKRPIETLSGGNQQKVVLARAMESGAPMLILDEPTAGVDVGAKSEIHKLIVALAAQGKGILLISSEMEEVMALADRILVIREGRLVEELLGHNASSLDLIKSALGESSGQASRAGR